MTAQEFWQRWIDLLPRMEAAVQVARDGALEAALEPLVAEMMVLVTLPSYAMLIREPVPNGKMGRAAQIRCFALLRLHLPGEQLSDLAAKIKQKARETTS